MNNQEAGRCIFYLVTTGGPCNGWGWSIGHVREVRRCWASSAWRGGREGQTLCPAILWCTRGKRTQFAKGSFCFTFYLRKVFHHEGGQSLEEGLEDVARSPALEILKFWLHKAHSNLLCRGLDNQRSLPTSIIPWVNGVFGRFVGLVLCLKSWLLIPLYFLCLGFSKLTMFQTVFYQLSI